MSQLADPTFRRDLAIRAVRNAVQVTVPVLGSQASARALPVIRIVAPDGNYDYQNK